VLVQSYNVTIADGHGGTLVQTVTVTITGANDAPVITSLPFAASVNEHGPGLSFAPTFTDPDLLDQQTFTVNTTGTHGLVANIQGGTILYDPNGAFASLAIGQTAVDHFTYSVVDNNGASSSQTASVTIIGQNDAPVAAADAVTVASGTTSANLWTSLLANDTDVDTAHTSLTITAVNTTGTAGAVSFNAATQSLTYHAPATLTPDTFQYTVSDGQGGTSTGTVSVNSDHLVTDNWLVSTNATAIFSAQSLLANDTSFNGNALHPLSLFSVSGPDATWDGTNITYTAPGSGTDSFTYTTTDSAGKHATGTVNVSLWDGTTTPVGNVANQAEWLVGSTSAPLTMTGSAGADHLQGGAGAAAITGGLGADTLSDGVGTLSNHFIYNNEGALGAGKDSTITAMDHITNFLAGTDIIELNGFAFSAASTALITTTSIKATAVFTSSDVAGYFADGNAIHIETQKTGIATNPLVQQIYVDVNHNGNFDAATDLVIHMDNSKGVTSVDFQFH
jgi:VCBS repeat-containing protein